jgi:6-phospho-beta-glucosidase
VARRAPKAWIVNFSNPVGIVTQAMRLENDRVVGICDTPSELFEEVAHALDLPARECDFDYFGLNHLGWLREVSWRGRPQLAAIWDRPEILARLYRAPLFAPEFLQHLRLLPTEYLFFYYRPGDALDNLKRAGTSRGAEIARLNVRLFEELASPGADRVAVYERYLAARDRSYMQLESGASAPLPRSPWAEVTGYDKIALAALHAIHFDTGAVIALDVANAGNLADLEDDDVVEVPCRVGANGPRPLHVRRPPGTVGSLITQVKTYERLTIRAAFSTDPARRADALAANPLVANRDLAARLVADLALA